MKFVTLKDFCAKDELTSDDESTSFLEEVIKKGIEVNSKSQIKHFKSDGLVNSLGLYQLMLKFASSGLNTYTEFTEFCSKTMDKSVCSQAAYLTTEQSNCNLWYELRYARITASKIYDAAHCKKPDGVFVNQVLGVCKLKSTMAMTNGKILEDKVVKSLKKNLNVNLKNIGLQLNPRFPIFGASPDAICDEYVM